MNGAAGVLIGSRAFSEQVGLKPRARIKAFAVVGSEPTLMLAGPIPATRKVLKRAGMTTADIDLFEVNEAFAVVPLLLMDELGVDVSKLNVNGGAIALGHPPGATGAIIAATLIDELERLNKQVGFATLCVGGGIGVATIFERGGLNKITYLLNKTNALTGTGRNKICVVAG